MTHDSVRFEQLNTRSRNDEGTRCKLTFGSDSSGWCRHHADAEGQQRRGSVSQMVRSGSRRASIAAGALLRQMQVHLVVPTLDNKEKQYRFGHTQLAVRGSERITSRVGMLFVLQYIGRRQDLLSLAESSTSAVQEGCHVSAPCCKQHAPAVAQLQ